MAYHTKITHPYIKRRLDTHQISQKSAEFGQNALIRLMKFANITSEKDVLTLPEQVFIDFLNAQKSINSYNSYVVFLKRMLKDNEITITEKRGKKEIERYFLSDMMRKKEDEAFEREKEQYFTNQPAIDAIIAACRNIRDKAIVQVLLEYGFRREELASVLIKNVKEDPVSGGINITCRVSKTRIRTVLGIHSAAIIRRWIHSEHPLIDPQTGVPPQDAPLYCITNGNYNSIGKPMTGEDIYDAYKHVRTRAIKIALSAKNTELAQGIKHIHPHSFRHYATTQEIIQGVSDAMIKVRRGWSKDSKMLGRYTHVDEDDANAGYAKTQGINIKEMKKKYTETPKQCPRCLNMNRASAKICDNCGSPLDLQAAAAVAQKVKAVETQQDIIAKILQNPTILIKVLEESKKAEMNE